MTYRLDTGFDYALRHDDFHDIAAAAPDSLLQTPAMPAIFFAIVYAFISITPIAFLAA